MNGENRYSEASLDIYGCKTWESQTFACVAITTVHPEVYYYYYHYY